jgi:hypothetical protein
MVGSRYAVYNTPRREIRVWKLLALIRPTRSVAKTCMSGEAE